MRMLREESLLVLACDLGQVEATLLSQHPHPRPSTQRPQAAFSRQTQRSKLRVEVSQEQHDDFSPARAMNKQSTITLNASKMTRAQLSPCGRGRLFRRQSGVDPFHDLEDLRLGLLTSLGLNTDSSLFECK
jgi:hypothetical protein